MERVERITLDINMNLSYLGDHQEFVLDYIADNLELPLSYYYNSFNEYLKRYDLNSVILDADVTYYQSVFRFRVDDLVSYEKLLYIVKRFINIMERKYDVKGFIKFYNNVMARSKTIKTSKREFEKRALKMYYKRFIKLN